MSCISNNFSSFFFNSFNDPSEFSKYLSNGELKFSPFEEFQIIGSSSSGSVALSIPHQVPILLPQHQQPNSASVNICSGNSTNNSSNSLPIVGYLNTVDVVNNNMQMESNNYIQPLPPLTQTHSQRTSYSQHSQQKQYQQSNPNLAHYGHSDCHPGSSTALLNTNNFNNHSQMPHLQHHHHTHHSNYAIPHRWSTAAASGSMPYSILEGCSTSTHAGAHHCDDSFEFLKYLRHSNDYNTLSEATLNSNIQTPTTSFNEQQPLQLHNLSEQQQQPPVPPPPPAQFPLSSSNFLDLDSNTSSRTSSRFSREIATMLLSMQRNSNNLESTALDVFDHDSKHMVFDVQHVGSNHSSNSNESCTEMSSSAFSNSHLNASNSNTSSESAGASVSDLIVPKSSSNGAQKPLTSFTIKESFDVHSSHKVEEGIFQHMNKLPPKKKDNLKQLGVRFTGQMTLADKSIVVENFIKFCQEYDIKDHRPFLSLNQSGLNKPEQIKFARYLGQGLPTFTLFCIYSNFKNLFCTKRTEIYTKDGYNLPYILDKTKRFLSNTTADLKNLTQQQLLDDVDFPEGTNQINSSNNNKINFADPNSSKNSLKNFNRTLTSQLGECGVDTFQQKNNTELVIPLTTIPAKNSKCTPLIFPKALKNLVIYENFNVHEAHRIEDGVCTHITRLPQKKQELLKQFGIQNNQSVTYYDKYIIIENFIKFCNDYTITDHRPFLDFQESSLPKFEQLKFVRYIGQGLPNLTLNKIYLSFKDILGLNRIERMTLDGYNLDLILMKKRKNLFNRMHSTGIS